MQSSGGYGGYYDSPLDPAREEDLRRSVDTDYGERRETSTGTTSPGSRDLDVPLDEPAPEYHPPHKQPASSAAPAGGTPTTDPFDADAAIRTGGETREEGGSRGGSRVRVYKRAARPSR
jgi:hypothetical protein